MSLFFKLCAKLGLSEDIGIVIRSDRLLAFAGSNPDVVVEIPLEHTPLIPPMPPARLSAEVRDGLTTRVHLGEFQSPQPIFKRAEMLNFEAAQDCVRDAIHQLTTPKSRFVKPRVVCCIPWEQEIVRKRALLDAVEHAGARQVFLAQSGVVTALGMGLDILKDKVYGILLVESDWSVFAVVSYADQIAHRFIPIGSNDIRDPTVHSSWRDRLLDEIASALSELRPPQINRLDECGVYCTGFAATNPWVKTMAEQIGIPCHLPEKKASHSPTVDGLRWFVTHLNDWKESAASETEPLPAEAGRF